MLSAVAEVEGSASEDTASIATVDVTYNEWMGNGFICDDHVDQSPPSAFAKDNHQFIISTTNRAHLDSVNDAYRKKIHPKVDDSDLDSRGYPVDSLGGR